MRVGSADDPRVLKAAPRALLAAPPGNTLVIAPQWIGDAVMTEPLLRRLAARGEKLTVAAIPAVAPVYHAMPQVSEVIELPFSRGTIELRARHRLARELAGRFQTAYVLPNSLKSALLPFLASIPRRIGYLGEVRVGLLTHRLKNPSRRPPMVAYYSALSGDGNVENDCPALHVDDAALAATLERHGVSERGYTVFAPGAEYGPAKRWPAPHFATVARELAEPVLLLGSPRDADVASRIAALAPHTVRDLTGQTTLTEAIHLIAGARRMLSNDSGLMHIAAAFGIEQIAVFGSSSPLHTPPMNPRATVLWLKNDLTYEPPLDCAPCFERDCPLGHTRCLVDLSPGRVLGAWG